MNHHTLTMTNLLNLTHTTAPQGHVRTLNDPRPEQFGNEMREVAAAKQMARNAGRWSYRRILVTA
jgi:hypothetical protein